MIFFWLSCIAAGCSLYLLVWVFTRPVIDHGHDARGHSHRFVVRVIWPWVSVLAIACGPVIPWRTRQRVSKLVRAAGIEAAWRVEHIIALQCLACLACCAVAVLALLSVDATAPSHWLLAVAGCGGSGAVWPRAWLKRQVAIRQRAMLAEFPFLLDMTTLCVEAGLNLHGALQQAASHGPAGPLRQELRHALADIRTGMPRLQALRALAARTEMPAMRQLTSALGQADQLGMSLGPLLRAQAEQRRAERFLRAEKLALEAPVKMLFPMVLCIFPCTFLIIGFPIVIKLMGADL